MFLGLRLRLGRRTSRLCNAFTSRLLLLLLLSSWPLSLRCLPFFLAAIRLLDNLALWRWLSLWHGLSFLLTAIHTSRLLDHLPLRRLSLRLGLPFFLALIHTGFTRGS